MSDSLQTLLVTSHVVHYRHEGQLFAFGPYAREIDIWADLFPRVLIASPCRKESPPGDCLPFSRASITILPQKETGGNTPGAKLAQLAALPGLILGLAKAMRRADAIHVRCPGNLGLLGTVLGPLFSRRLVAKYAGQWNGYDGESATVRLQRAILRSQWWRGPVTVYGEWPDQPAHIVPFFTSMMSSEMVERAVRVAEERKPSKPLRVLFSGRLEPVKRVSVLPEALRIAVDQGTPLEAVFVGGGSEEERLRREIQRLGLDNCVRITGALPFERAIAWNEWADCLVLPSTHSEGWPKVIAEAMCYGLVSIAVEHGQVGRMLEGRGILMKQGTPEEIASALREIDRLPACGIRKLSLDASHWARRYTLEGLRTALRDLLEARWAASLRPVPQTADV